MFLEVKLIKKNFCAHSSNEDVYFSYKYFIQFNANILHKKYVLSEFLH